MLDMYLNENCYDLSFHEVQYIFSRTERTLLNMVPNTIELNLIQEPLNKVWLLRPEARFLGGSQLS